MNDQQLFSTLTDAERQEAWDAGYRAGRASMVTPVEEMGGPALHSEPTRTERAAAYMQIPRLGTVRAKVLDTIAAAEDGMTAPEVAKSTGVYLYTAAPRVTELRDAGWLADTGRTRPTDRGTEAIVWALTPEGRDAL